MRTRRIARIVAAEAAYRARRRNLRVGFTQAGEVSAAKANVLQGVFFTMFSAMAVVAAIFAKSVETVVLVLLSSVALTAFFNLMFMVSFTAIFFSEELFKPLQILPIEPGSLEKILVTAYMLYWGGLSVLALSIPAAVLIPLIAPRYAAYALLAGAAAIAVYVVSTEAGLLLGSYSRLAKSNLFLSMASAAGWVVLMLLFAFMPQLPMFLEKAGIGLSPLYALIPFIGFILAPLYPLPAAASLAATAAAVYIIHGKARAACLGEPSLKIPVSYRKGFRGHRPLGRTLGLVRKDYLLIIREPRRLAGIAYLYVFPFIFILGGMKTSIWSILAGVAMGVSASIWIYIEGEAARHLYELPLTFLDIYGSKLVDSLIPLAVVSAALPLVGATPTALYYIATCYVAEASAMIALSLSMIPREPSAWSEAAASKATHIVWLLVTMTVFTAVPMAAYFVKPFYGVLASAALCVSSLSLGLYYSWRRGPL